jgi:putative hydrolase of the HAD superfamily
LGNWRAVVFDLDDTLYPERSFVLSGFKAVARWAETYLAIPAQEGYATLVALFEAGVREKTFELWLGERATPDQIQRLVQVYREHQPDIQPFPEIEPILKRLKGHYRLGLVSDGYLSVQMNKLAALKLEPYFDAVVFSDQWGRAAWKPSTKPFEAVIHNLRVAASESIYIGDNPLKDFYGARQLGLATICYQRPGGEYANAAPPSKAHAATWTIHSLDELNHILRAAS